MDAPEAGSWHHPAPNWGRLPDSSLAECSGADWCWQALCLGTIPGVALVVCGVVRRGPACWAGSGHESCASEAAVRVRTFLRRLSARHGDQTVGPAMGETRGRHPVELPLRYPPGCAQSTQTPPNTNNKQQQTQDVARQAAGSGHQASCIRHPLQGRLVRAHPAAAPEADDLAPRADDVAADRKAGQHSEKRPSKGSSGSSSDKDRRVARRLSVRESHARALDVGGDLCLSVSNMVTDSGDVRTALSLRKHVFMCADRSRLEIPAANHIIFTQCFPLLGNWWHLRDYLFILVADDHQCVCVCYLGRTKLYMLRPAIVFVLHCAVACTRLVLVLTALARAPMVALVGGQAWSASSGRSLIGGRW